MRVVGVGRWVFAATLVAIGVLVLIRGDFAAMWQPVPKWAPARAVLVYVCALVSLTAGAGLLWRRTDALAAGGLLVWLLLWMALFRAPVIWRAPAAVLSWENWGESAVMVAGAWALWAGGAGFAAGETGVRIARALYGLALIPFGLTHLAYIKETAALVPAWLPSHAAWAYVTGFAYVAAGVAVVTGVFARLAAALSALQMGGFTLLVWAPMLAAGSGNAFQWDEGFISLALTAAGWVVADTYRGAPWLLRRAFPGATRGGADLPRSTDI